MALDSLAPLKVDLGCGRKTPAGWHGVDVSPDVGADLVADLTKPWPIPDGWIAEARCSHFFEHLTPPQRCHFMRELHRTLVPGGTATITTPLGFNRMAQDPDHKWPPVVRGTYYYYSRRWREDNELQHYETLHGLDMDFEIVSTAVKYDPDQYAASLGKDRLELLLMTDPDAQTDLVVVLRRIP